VELISEFNTLKKYIDLESDFLSTEDYFNKTKDLITVFSHTDGKVRDELGWATLSIYFQSELFPSASREELLNILSSNEFLFFEMEKGESDSSVKRSFSVLAMSDLLWGDQDFGNRLESDFLKNITKKVTDYLLLEKDERGFDERLGWVHGIAHSGDTLSALAMHPNNGAESVRLIVESIIKYLLKREFRIFKWDENFRLSRPIGRAIARLEKAEVEKLLINKLPEGLLYETSARQNIINTLRCLFIELKCNEFDGNYLYEWIKKVVR
jgi:hypothetical protein